MEHMNHYLYPVDTVDNDYLDWIHHPFLSQQLFNNTIATNYEPMQYTHHPSDLPAHYYQQLQQKTRPSPIDDDDDDDDDSLDCSISTPLQFCIPTFDKGKDKLQKHDAKTSGCTSNIPPLSLQSPSSASASSSFSSSSSSLDLTYPNWSSNFLGDYAVNISRSYVSLSDVNAFVAKADSIKHSNWTNETPSSLFIDPFLPSAESTTEDQSEVLLPTHPLSYDLAHHKRLSYHSGDDDDTEYISLAAQRTKHPKRRQSTKSLAMKNGRNVDKACNHCKHSHLRCDEMRPCRRCICTGKTDCQDVQHKPRGRPKLYKKVK